MFRAEVIHSVHRKGICFSPKIRELVAMGGWDGENCIFNDLFTQMPADKKIHNTRAGVCSEYLSVKLKVISFSDS